MAKPFRSSSDDQFRALLASVGFDERLKVVRAYYPGFTTRDGYDPKKGLTTAQKQKITAYYKSIRPYLGAPLVRRKLPDLDHSIAAWRGLFGIEPPRDTLYVPILESPENDPRLVFTREVLPKATPEAMLKRLREYHPGQYTAKKGFTPATVKKLKGKKKTAFQNAYKDTAEIVLQSVRLKGGIHVNKHYFEDYGLTEKVLVHPDTKKVDGQILDMLDATGGTHFAIIAGDYLYGIGGKRGEKEEVFMGQPTTVLARIRQLQGQYSKEKVGENRAWQNWLHGVKSFQFKGGFEQKEKHRLANKAARKTYQKEKRRLTQLNRNIYNLSLRLKSWEPEIKLWTESVAYDKKMKVSPKRIRETTGRYLAKWKRKEKRALDLMKKSIRERQELIALITQKKIVSE